MSHEPPKGGFSFGSKLVAIIFVALNTGVPMLIGYKRVSTDSQNLDLQDDALKRAGCSIIFEDVASGALNARPGLVKALQYLKKDDVLVVYSLSRLGRNMAHLIDTVYGLSERGIGFKTLTENIDTSSPSGRLTLGVFSSLCQFERELIRERTMAGLASARERGRVGGRRAKLSESQSIIAEQLFKERQLSVNEIARSLGVSRSTVYRNLK